MDTALVHEFLSCIKHFNQTCAWHQMQKHVMGEMLVLDRLRRYGQTTPGNLSKQLQLSTARTAAAWPGSGGRSAPTGPAAQRCAGG